jgi:hypothetical protein
MSDSGRTSRVINSLESPTKTVDVKGGASKKKISIISVVICVISVIYVISVIDKKFIVITFFKGGMNVNSIEVYTILIIAEFPL